MRPARRELLRRSVDLSALWASSAAAQGAMARSSSGLEDSEAVHSDAQRAVRSDEALAVGYLAPYQRGTDHAGVAFLDPDGFLLSELELPARAHGVTADPKHRWGCVFARRPGDFFVVVDLHRRRIVRRVSASAGRRFYGHGTFSSDGTHLFATENDYEAQRGVIGVFDVARAFQRVAKMPSGGIGPHDVLRLPGTDALLVAIGGIATHPDSGRDKLNIDSMQPSIARIDPRTGLSIEQFSLLERLHQVSLRHLACDS